jgi:CRP/FNR family transcriptional regulator, anaerobic regulatory protein
MDLAPSDTASANAVEFADICEPFVVPTASSLQVPAVIDGNEVFLDRGAVLFREGDLKDGVYRLESGILCITARRSSGPPRVIEMVFPGTLIGLGFLERHIHSAMAVVASRLTAFPLSAVADICGASPEARDRQALSTEREFAARRRELVPDSNEMPVRRVAAFLAAMHHMNKREGRNPDLIDEFLKTGDVAAFLDLDVEALARALTDLFDRGLVVRAQNGGLILLDAHALDELSS